MLGCELESSVLGQGPVAACCEHCNEQIQTLVVRRT
jgi:hypothetical protein